MYDSEKGKLEQHWIDENDCFISNSRRFSVRNMHFCYCYCKILGRFASAGRQIDLQADSYLFFSSFFASLLFLVVFSFYLSCAYSERCTLCTIACVFPEEPISKLVAMNVFYIAENKHTHTHKFPL